MAVFALRSGVEEDSREVAPLLLADLGSCEETGTFSCRGISVLWAHPRSCGRPKIFRWPNRFLFIDGEVDRNPFEEESLERWLPGRWGSFRGFEILLGPDPRLTVFVDPLGTRPLFYSRQPDGWYLSDKLSSLALSLPGGARPNWPAILEAALLGALYEADVTVDGAAQLKPGEVVEFSGTGARLRFQVATGHAPNFNAHRVESDPAGSLLPALSSAVAESWIDPGAWLLLSGGLDSRFTLALAGPGRKALTVTTRENRESRVARAIATSCGAFFRHWMRPAEHYLSVLRRSFLLTACMYDPVTPHHLGLGAQWREEGIHKVANAFLFDTVLKDFFVCSYQKSVSPYTSLFGILGGVSQLFSGKRSGRDCPETSELLLSALCPDGRQVAERRLKRLAGSLQPVISDGLNLTLRERVLQSISRQCHYPILLGWIEELDVVSPLFHPSVWSWAQSCPPRELAGGAAFCRALLATNHPASRLMNSNTGRPPQTDKFDARKSVRNQPWYPFARSLWRRLRPQCKETPSGDKSYADEGAWPPLAPVFREKAGFEILEEGLAFLERDSPFDQGRVRTLLQSFRNGDDHCLEAVMTLSAIGRWIAFLKEPARHAAGRTA